MDHICFFLRRSLGSLPRKVTPSCSQLVKSSWSMAQEDPQLKRSVRQVFDNCDRTAQ